MPAAFEKCIDAKGTRKVTKSLPKGQYVHGCSYNGKKWYWGEVKKKKTGLMAGKD